LNTQTSKQIHSNTMPSQNQQQTSSRSGLPLHLINLFAYGLNTLVTYGVGAAGWWDLPSNAALSAKYQTLVTPAGWAFSIWGIIFVSQLVWTVWQQPILRRLDDDPNNVVPPMVKAVGLDYLYVCLAQIGWTAAFSTEHIGLSLVFMVMILAFLLLILSNLRRLDSQDSFFLYQFPFSIHAAWIMAAVVVNLNVVLVWAEASALAQFVVGAASLLILLSEALLRLHHSVGSRHTMDLTFPIVLIWALVAVHSELSSPKDAIAERFSQQEIEAVRLGAVGGAAVLGLATVVQSIRHSWAVDSTSTPEEAASLRPSDNGGSAK
jgi:hypothetical protein